MPVDSSFEWLRENVLSLKGVGPKKNLMIGAKVEEPVELSPKWLCKDAPTAPGCRAQRPDMSPGDVPL